ncbi:MAG TPA: hypothetical protein VFZ79_07145 [Acidimicrobiales bacterium]
MTGELGFTGPADAPGDYEIVEVVTAGGQAHLFRARLRSDRLGEALGGAEVALKQFRSEAVGVERFAELADVVGARRHPHLARQVEVFRGAAPRPGTGDRAGDEVDEPDDRDDADLLYAAYVWVPGEPLDVAAAREGVSLARVLTWVRQVGEALDFLHADVHDEGPLVHRDVKPSNVIVTPAGDAVLIDPGVARVAAAGATGTPWGSPGFVPPETVAGAGGGPASDRWQLAATLVAALLGHAPGTRLQREVVRPRLVGRLAGETALPGPTADRILAMLAPDPADRPRSAGGWATELAVLAGSGAAGRDPVARRRRALVAGGAAALALAAVVVGVALWRGDGGGGGEAEPPERVVAVIDNRVTDGPGMREDTPAYLATVAENFCRPNGCEVPGTDLVSGDELVLTCQTVGQRTTNGDDTSTADDGNPELYESRLWYYGVLEGRGEGFISESWIADEFRGGMDLPLC